MWLRALLVGMCLAGALGACSMVDPVDRRYDTITRSLAKARNEAIFLNLIRASHDYPLSFTAIANVTPGISNSTSFALPSFVFGPGTAGATIGGSTSPQRDLVFGNSTAANSTSVSTNFNISTEETGAFYNGFLKPIDLTILDYFIRQGYSRELLFWLFTDSFELKLPGQRLLGFHFHPPDDLGCDLSDRKQRCFIDWVHNAALSGLTVEEKTQERASSGGGQGHSSDSGGSAGKPTIYTYARFCFNYVLFKQAAALAPEFAQRLTADLDVSQADVFGGDLRCGSSSWHPEKDATKPQEDILPLEFKNKTIQFRIIPRSAYGVFQFLGTLIKLQQEGYQPQAYPPGMPNPRGYPAQRPWAQFLPPQLATLGNAPLITVTRNRVGGHCFVRSWFEDGEYCVPDNDTISKQTFGLLAQLIAIQTAASDLSITPIVRVIQ
jgi:hypothetical protein